MPATHGLSESSEYRSWHHMKLRCYWTKAKGYENYGGRGITVCGEWRDSFAAFYAHIGPKPGPGYTLDRIDNDGNYEPGNVRWATRSEQRENQRRRVPKAVCKNGHEFTQENTQVDPRTGWRRCVTCSRETAARTYARRVANRVAS